MKLFHNNYDKLKQDNIDESVKLSAENYCALGRMVRYISSHNISLFEVEVLKKDLIGIIMEAEVEQIPLEEKLGVAEKEFCDGLLEESLKRNGYEPFLIFIKNIMLWICFLHLFKFILYGMPENCSYSFTELWSWVIIGALVDLIEVKHLGKFTFQMRRKKLRNITFGIILIVCIMVDLISGILLDFPTIEVNGWAATVIVLVITFAVLQINNYYWNRCSLKYNWE